jgi:hypothetical protein
MEVNKEELRRLAEAFPKTEITSASAAAMLKLWIDLASPAAILSLLDEVEYREDKAARAERNREMWKAQCGEQAVSLDQLRAENERLLGLLVQCALSAATLRADAPHYANHSGFNEKFTDAIRKASGVNIGHGVASPKYPSQADAIAAMANDGGEN